MAVVGMVMPIIEKELGVLRKRPQEAVSTAKGKTAPSEKGTWSGKMAALATLMQE